ncbi:hypothetical protein ACGC1H_003007 [Rhizoctonia solani]
MRCATLSMAPGRSHTAPVHVRCQIIHPGYLFLLPSEIGPLPTLKFSIRFKEQLVALTSVSANRVVKFERVPRGVSLALQLPVLVLFFWLLVGLGRGSPTHRKDNLSFGDCLFHPWVIDKPKNHAHLSETVTSN